jgi:hypothetical protein
VALGDKVFGTDSVNTRTKMIKRQMYSRAGFALPPDPAQLTPRSVTTESATEPLN